MTEPQLSIRHLRVYYGTTAGPPVRAVDDVSLDIGEREVRALLKAVRALAQP